VRIDQCGAFPRCLQQDYHRRLWLINNAALRRPPPPILPTPTLTGSITHLPNFRSLLEVFISSSAAPDGCPHAVRAAYWRSSRASRSVSIDSNHALPPHHRSVMSRSCPSASSAADAGHIHFKRPVVCDTPLSYLSGSHQRHSGAYEMRAPASLAA